MKRKTIGYTVILAYPGDFGDPMTYLAHVKAEIGDINTAVAKARRQMAKADDCDITWYETAPVIAVFMGWRTDIYDGRCD